VRRKSKEKEGREGEMSMELTGKMRLAGFGVLRQVERHFGAAERGFRPKKRNSQDQKMAAGGYTDRA
jgi:hypothetical protein